MKSKIFIFFIISLISIFINGFSINDQSLAPEQPVIEEQPVNEEQPEIVIEDIFQFILINDGTAYSLSKCVNYNEEVIVPSTYKGLPVIQIDNYAFANNKELKNIILPDSIINIDEMAFIGSGLVNITIPMNVSAIGALAFTHCKNLTEINVDSRNTFYQSIDGVLFNYSGTDLCQYPIGNPRTSYIVPSGILNIKMSAFEYSDILESIILPESLLGLEQNSIADCNELKEIFIPKNVNYISLVFYNCKKLENINVSEDNMYYKSVNGVLFDKDLSCLYIYPAGKKASGYIIPYTVTEVSSAFFKVDSLKLLIITENVKILYSGAIYHCMNLKTVIIQCINPPRSSEEVLKFCDESTSKQVFLTDLVIYVPSESLELYKSTENWSDFKDNFLILE